MLVIYSVLFLIFLVSYIGDAITSAHVSYVFDYTMIDRITLLQYYDTAMQVKLSSLAVEYLFYSNMIDATILQCR